MSRAKKKRINAMRRKQAIQLRNAVLDSLDKGGLLQRFLGRYIYERVAADGRRCGFVDLSRALVCQRELGHDGPHYAGPVVRMPEGLEK